MLFFGKKSHGMLKKDDRKLRPVTPTLNLNSSAEKRAVTADFSQNNAAPQTRTFPLSPRNIYPAPHDIDGTGVSDILLIQNQPDFQIGFWRNAAQNWQSTNTVHAAGWEILGTYDMTGNGKADIVAMANINGSVILGYYQDSIDTDDRWHTLGTLEAVPDNDWQITIGKLFGSQKKDVAVCFSPSAGKLGILGNTPEDWLEIPGAWSASWQLLGCGDFNAAGKKTLVLKFLETDEYFSLDLEGNLQQLGALDDKWQLCAIGDFDGTGKDDILFVNAELSIVLKWQNGNGNMWQQLGQLDMQDWQIVSVGRYSGRNCDELLVQQKSTGMLGYFIHGSFNMWREIGSVGSDWRVLA